MTSVINNFESLSSPKKHNVPNRAYKLAIFDVDLFANPVAESKNLNDGSVGTTMVLVKPPVKVLQRSPVSIGLGKNCLATDSTAAELRRPW